MLTIDLPPQAERQLQKTAMETGKSAEQWAQEILLSHLEDLEDIRDVEEIMKSDDPRSNTSLDEMIARYGLED